MQHPETTTSDSGDNHTHEVEACVVDLLTRLLPPPADEDTPRAHLDRYHKITRNQQILQQAYWQVSKALTAERGYELRQTGMTQSALTKPTGIPTQQAVQKIMAAGRQRDPIAIRITGQQSQGQRSAR